MAFDKPTRNRLASFVAEARRLIADEFTQQFQSLYGISDKGTITPLDQLGHLDDAGLATAALLRERIDYLVKTHPDDREGLKAAVARLAREQAFTVLNRLAAIRMTEKRGLIAESVGKGYQSRGFKVFEQVAGSGLGDTYERYRRYLFCLFDELAVDLGVLFDRRSPQGLLFPRETTLLALLPLLNGPDLDPLWIEDETIGWIYQYYNDPAERKKMREESAAPRNSRELAVRNQFFTPRYVVEFLTDNTLGRIWYEMTKGETRLNDQCRYLVCRPTEIFLGIEAVGPATQSQEGLSQEELLQQPVYSPHRTLKDPRELRMLDPACGSMHFGLYAFDLYEVIYEEAWDLGVGTLRADFPDRETFLREVPRLIIERNIHGIDIDPRAVQIAGLSLWLRAQKSWQKRRVSAIQRPPILRSNIVCAEPMPGDKQMLREFVASQFETGEQPAFSFLLERVFDRMTLAGEAGSLLKIEEEISAAVGEAKGLWQKGPEYKQGNLFGDLLPKKPEQLRLDLTGITDERFWATVEEQIYTALQVYTEQAESGGYQRRLFAEDAARGFAFIDLCRQRYDVALMNPPFGDASLPSKPYLDDTYGDTKGDVYKAFVECFQARLISAGYLGIISSRTGFFLGQSEDWRTRVVLRLFRPIVLADLGMGVLDAMVEVAAYVLRSLSMSETRDLTLSLVPSLEKVVRDKQDRFSLPKWQAARDGLKRHQASAELEHLETSGFIQRCAGNIVRYTPLWRAVKAVKVPSKPVFPPLVCIRALEDEDKGGVLADAVRGSAKMKTFVCNPSGFQALPSRAFGYWVSEKIRQLFVSLPLFRDSSDRLACITNPAGDDTRYFRCFWEPPVELLGRTKRWAPLAKGGEFRRYYADQHLVVNWDDKIGSYTGFLGTPHRPLIRPASSDSFFRAGLTYSRRSQKGFSVRALPAETIFHDKGPGIFAPESELLPMLAVFNSSVYSSLLALQMAFGSYEVGVVQRTPMPRTFGELEIPLATLAQQAWRERRTHEIAISTSHAFVLPQLLMESTKTLTEGAAAWVARVRTSEATIATIQTKIDDLAFRLYGLDTTDRAALATNLATESTVDTVAEADENEEEQTSSIDAPMLTADLLAYALGAAFGRWDVRLATGQKNTPPEPGPFDPIPVCPPGMLQNNVGLPSTPADLSADYPLRISWHGILVDDPNHSEDFDCRIRDALVVLFPDSTDSIADEACELMGVKTLRDYFRKPSGFFADHLKRYSKSRRQAPIYWPLSTAKGSYTLWLYYPRFTDQTLHTALADFAEPKLKDVHAEISILRESNNNSTRLEELLDLENELIDFHSEIERIIKLPWKPNLNDGVIITASPLWKLFRLPKWQKDLKACWEKLEKGDYDWAHLAYSIWPKRVEEVCKKDRSVAIAHNLEHLCQIEPPKPKAKRGKKAAS